MELIRKLQKRVNMRTKAKILSILFTVLLLVFSAISFAIENDSVELGFADERLTAVEKDSSDQSLSYNGSITLDKESYAFKGKAIKPKVEVFYDGKKIKKNKDYKLEFADNAAIGYGSVTAIGVGIYTGSITLEFPIIPKPVKINKILKIESGFEAQWKVAKDADGYEIEYSLQSDFSDSEVIIIEGNANNTFKKSYLEPLKRYYIRLRSYKNLSDGTFYSSWSKAKKFLVPSYQVNGTYMVIDLSGGPNAVRYPISYLHSEPAGGWTTEYKSTKMVLRLVSAGKFMMGSPENELGHCDDEILHLVTLTKPFYVGVFEVTQKQYKLVTGEDPSEYKGDARPVENVKWINIRGNEKGCDWPDNDNVDEWSFLGKLRTKTGFKFDLPTEAQWEYACRAGTTTALNNGTNITNCYYDGNLNLLARWSYSGGGDYDENGNCLGHIIVGSYLPNAWGLYDMHGNVDEWCLDWDYSYTSDPVIDPIGDYQRVYKIIRGGSWGEDRAYYMRSSFRNDYNPSWSESWIGFRLVLIL